MMNTRRIIFICILFSISGWIGATSFIFTNQEWLLEGSNSSFFTCSLHQNALRSTLLSLGFGLLFAFPLEFLHRWQSKMKKPIRWIVLIGAHIMLAPIVIFLINYMYLVIWPSEKDMLRLDIVYILMSSGWKQFFGAYFFLIMAPLSFFGLRTNRKNQS